MLPLNFIPAVVPRHHGLAEVIPVPFDTLQYNGELCSNCVQTLSFLRIYGISVIIDSLRYRILNSAIEDAETGKINICLIDPGYIGLKGCSFECMICWYR